MASDEGHDPVDGLLAIEKCADTACKMVSFDLIHCVRHACLPRRSYFKCAVKTIHDRPAQPRNDRAITDNLATLQHRCRRTTGANSVLANSMVIDPISLCFLRNHGMRLWNSLSSSRRAREERLPLAHAFLGDIESLPLSSIRLNKDPHAEDSARNVEVDMLPAELVSRKIGPR